MKKFLHRIEKKPKPISILDVGGTPEFWQGRLPAGVKLTILNVYQQTPLQGETVLVSDGCKMQFKDQEFDVVFCNSVLAFVGNEDSQRWLCEEIVRVGRSYYVQTPNQGFPVDWRTLMPFYHWLPVGVRARIHTLTRVGRYARIPNRFDALREAIRVRDVNRKQLQTLFPKAVITSEKVMGITKSFEVWGDHFTP